jgi:coenzyme F420-reducing hydrogenase beta subunit
MMGNQPNQLLSKITRKKWTADRVEKYIGKYQGCFFTYANDIAIRRNAASGGSITALLSFLLSKGQIDGALVCRGKVSEDGKYRPEFFIARTVEALQQAQGSKYTTVYFSHEAIPLIRAFEGRLAVVALPCDTSILTRLCQTDPELNKKIALKITLFCGHNSESELTDAIVQRIQPGDRKLLAFRHRLGHWRGYLQADFEEGHRITRPFSFFSDYQNLYFFCERKCQRCNDHTGYNSDISAGDIWSIRMKKEPIKHTALIVRNEVGENILQKAIEDGWITARQEPIEEVCEGQARGLPSHYNVSARSRMAWIIGEKIKDTVHERVSLPEYLVAGIMLANEKLSHTESGRKIVFKMPKIFIKLYLYLFKALESL